MDYSLLKPAIASTAENLSVSVNTFAHFINTTSTSTNSAMDLDRVRASAAGSASPSAISCYDADDALLMDCSRSSSSAVTPNPPQSHLTMQPSHRHEDSMHSPIKSMQPALEQSTKLKLNFSMDRILSREPVDFCAASRLAQVDRSPVSRDDALIADRLSWMGQCDGANLGTGEVNFENAGGLTPVAFSVASMLGLGGGVGGGKPVFRPMPVYLSQSASAPHSHPNDSATTTPNIMMQHTSAMYPMNPTQRSSPIDRRLPAHLSHISPHSLHSVGILQQPPHIQHNHQHHQQHHHLQHHHSQQQHFHLQHPHQTPTITLVESSPSIGIGNGNGCSTSGHNANNVKRKRSWSRAVFSQLQRKGLEIQFQIQKYITKPDRRKLAARLSLTDAQVKVWFQNRRMKWRHTRETKLASAPHGMHGAKMVGGDDLKHVTSSSSDEDDIDVVAE